MKDARSSSRTESENKEPEEDTLGRDLRGTSTTSEERTNSRTTGNKPQRIRLQPRRGAQHGKLFKVTGASTLTGRGSGRTGGRLATSLNGFDYNQDEELDMESSRTTDNKHQRIRLQPRQGTQHRKLLRSLGQVP
jgi:hypothetical protein